jgi:hypothetical protein
VRARPEREYTVQVVIGTEHDGLAPYFKHLEDELVHCFAKLDTARQARDFAEALRKYLRWRSDGQAATLSRT